MKVPYSEEIANHLTACFELYGNCGNTLASGGLVDR
jgi:hypothetical protein